MSSVKNYKLKSGREIQIIECILTENECYQKGRLMKPIGVGWHDTGAGNPNINRYVKPIKENVDELIQLLGVHRYNYHWNKSGVKKCVHFFIGKLANGEVGIVQTLPLNMMCWGAGGSANLNYIQFEICDDGYQSEEYFNECMNKAALLTAWLCETLKIPLEHVHDHAELHDLGMASNHGDIGRWCRTFNTDMRNMVKLTAERMNKEMVVKHYIVNRAIALRSRPSVNNYYTGKRATVGTIVSADAAIVTEGNNQFIQHGDYWLHLKYVPPVYMYVDIEQPTENPTDDFKQKIAEANNKILENANKIKEYVQ